MAAGYGPNLDLFVPDDRPGFMRTNPEVARRYFTRTTGRVPFPPDDVFRETKPANGYRVFMMGGSTTAGWPYPPNVIPSEILERRLAQAFPSREIEVVNVGIAAVNTFTLLDFTDEILAWGPDAVIVYAGHNEYYGALGSASVESAGNARWIVRAYLSLMRFRTARLLRDALARFGNAEDGPTLMGRVVRENVPYGGRAYDRGRENFRKNLDAIASHFSRKHVPLFLSELVSNVRDFPPFVPGPAQDAFRDARQLENSGRIDEARAMYVRAKDLDALRFRAPEEFNTIIHEVAARQGAEIVRMKDVFESRSPDGLPGSSLFLEHLHPNAEGYRIMAEAFFAAMRETGQIGRDWHDVDVEWPVTELDEEIGRLIVMDLMDYWPFEPAGNPGNAFANFEPQSPVEEFAYRVAGGEMDFVEAHERLASLYDGSGEPELARRERDAIRAASPYPEP